MEKLEDGQCQKEEKVPEILIPPSQPPEFTYVPFTYLTLFEITVTRGSSVGIPVTRVCESEDFGLESQHRQEILLFSNLPNPLQAVFSLLFDRFLRARGGWGVGVGVASCRSVKHSPPSSERVKN